MTENGSVSAGCSEAYCDAPLRSGGPQLMELLKKQARQTFIAPRGCSNPTGYKSCMAKPGSVVAACS